MDTSRTPSSGFVQLWAKTEDEELVPRVLITSNRHQMGKTAAMIRIQEKVQEELHGRKFTIDDCALTCLEFMERRKKVPEWTPLGLDEPERPIGNKNYWDQEAQLFVEDLMTSPFRHIPAIFALPHSHYLNLSVYGVATSQIVKHTKTDCELFEMERDQLNRTFKTYTHKRGHFTIDMPYAWDWKDYCEKRDRFDTNRGKVLEDKVRALHAEARDLSKEQIYQMVMADKERFMDQRSGRISPTLIEQKLGVPYNKAQYAAGKANRLQRELELAEIDRVSGS